MNKLLQRQLQKYLATIHHQAPDQLIPLLNAISESYDHYEKDRKMLERSIELSSNEMIELNTELSKEKEELKKAHKELKTLFEDIDEAFYSLDVIACRLKQMSAACEKIYGYTSAEFLADGNLWHTLIHPDDKALRKQHYQIISQGKQAIVQYRIIHKNKSIRWVENKISPSFDENGRLIRIDGATSDISERKEAEIELETSFSILEATIESTADGILVADFNGKIVRFNKKFVELWRIPLEILETRNDEKAIAFVVSQLSNPQQFISKVKELYLQKKEVSFDILKFKDGRVFERYSQPQLINGNFVGRVWSFRDITARKIAEETILRSEANLELKNKQLEQKNKELEQFAFVASHDLQEPLRTIGSFVEIFKQQYFGKLDSKSDKYLHYIVQASDRMSVLIKDLLDFSRIGNNKNLELGDCNAILKEVIEDVNKAVVESNASVMICDLPVISCYRTELKQLFQNLLLNAIKFRNQHSAPQIKISAQKTGAYWQFSFADNGIGIEKRYSERIFDIFQRLHSRTEYEGSGIGLSHCKKIVELHHGKIWMESLTGKGSTFYFTILINKGQRTDSALSENKINT